MNQTIETFAKYPIYALALISIIATSPSETLVSSDAVMEDNIIVLNADTQFVSFTINSAITNPEVDAVQDIDWCATQMEFLMTEDFPENSQIQVWKLENPWDQSAFDSLYSDDSGGLSFEDAMWELSLDMVWLYIGAVETSATESAYYADAMFDAECENDTSYFVVSLTGDLSTIEMNLTAMARKGTAYTAPTLSCFDPSRPDFSDVEVTGEISF